AQNGNDALAAQLECAKENAMLAADGAMQSIDPIATILAIAAPFFELLPGAPTIQLPQLASDGSLDSLTQTITTREQVVLTIEGAAEAIPLCRRPSLRRGRHRVPFSARAWPSRSP